MAMPHSGVTTPSNFEPFDKAWQRFAEQYPMLGLSGTRWAGVHVRRVHGVALLASGAAVRTASGVWLAHRQLFTDCMFKVLVSHDVQQPPSTTPPRAMESRDDVGVSS